MNAFPAERIAPLNQAPIHPEADFVLYCMIAFRRPQWNFSLQRAVDWACELAKPLLILEALSCDYPWASERFHSFLLEGMQDNRNDFQSTPVYYFPFVERSRGEGKGLVRELGARSCVMVTDDYPCFFLPHMIRSLGKSLNTRVEAIDSNGLLPMARAEKVFKTAYSFRRYLQQQLPDFLDAFPRDNPLSGVDIPRLKEIPAQVAGRWARADTILSRPTEWIGKLPVCHAVKPVEAKGGFRAAKKRLADFLGGSFGGYLMGRNHPDKKATSRLSAYLHFGHISVHEIFSELKKIERWSIKNLSPATRGKREGWWGMSPDAEAFLEQLVTWRELGFNMCSKREDYDRFDSLPDWAIETLRAHENDPRPHVYTLEEFEAAKTHDPLWNAAQRQLLVEGRIHNYPRMLWGKKILEWTSFPREALAIMIALNNKYALDGRDPNSYTGISWVLGRYDRPFGPGKTIFGTLRYMSSRSAMRKIRISEYMRNFAP